MGAIAYDGTHPIFGTGNTCQTPIMTSNGAVSLNPDGTANWDMVAVRIPRPVPSPENAGACASDQLAEDILPNNRRTQQAGQGRCIEKQGRCRVGVSG